MLAIAGFSEKLAAVYRELAAVEIADGDSSDTYTSENLPPDCRTRRTFADYLRAHQVDGARLVGQTWIVSRAAWLAARTRKVTLTKLRPVASIAKTDDELADEYLASSGLRLTGRAR